MGSENLLTKLSAATVADAIDILHAMTNADGESGFGNLHIGDYLDLPSIDIAADSNAANTPNGTITNNTSYENLRIVIAGFNLWKGLDGNTKNHICFNFKQMPCRAYINNPSKTAGGYPALSGRVFLRDKFLPGLKAALGTTNKYSYHYAVTRHVSAGGQDTTIQDELFLFNAQEINPGAVLNIGGVAPNADVLENQIGIPWFGNNKVNRIKRFNSSAVTYGWWTATPYLRSPGVYYAVYTEDTYAGTTNITTSSVALIGISPSFCLC
jgi:hypothetical protein